MALSGSSVELMEAVIWFSVASARALPWVC